MWGDDSLTVHDTGIRRRAAIDGGGGRDAIRHEGGSVTIDLSGAKVRSIEVLDLSALRFFANDCGEGGDVVFTCTAGTVLRVEGVTDPQSLAPAIELI